MGREERAWRGGPPSLLARQRGARHRERPGSPWRAVGVGAVEDDRDDFALRPLEVSLVFAGRSFSLLFLFSFYFFSVFDLIEVANELQIL